MWKSACIIRVNNRLYKTGRGRTSYSSVCPILYAERLPFAEASFALALFFKKIPECGNINNLKSIFL